jgi:hypothetical protein
MCRGGADFKQQVNAREIALWDCLPVPPLAEAVRFCRYLYINVTLCNRLASTRSETVVHARKLGRQPLPSPGLALGALVGAN